MFTTKKKGESKSRVSDSEVYEEKSNISRKVRPT